MAKVRIALPKGRFYDKSLAIIENNINQSVFDIKSSKKLVFESEDYVFFFLKSSDICLFIFNDYVDIGIVPDEWILEYELQHKINFNKLMKIGWVNTRISLVSDFIKNIHENDTVASSYPFITRNYLKQKVPNFNNKGKKVCKLSGSIEATVPRIFSFGVDCVESGSTLAHNSLVEVDIIYNNLALSLISKNGNGIDLNRIKNLNL